MRRRSATLFFALTIAGICSVALTERLEAAAPTPADPTKAPKVKKPVVPPRNCADPDDRDRDHDGHPVMECGGDDCDDTDGFRFPGAGREFCDGLLPDGRPAAGHDEDCNPCTVNGSGAEGDEDRDGAISAGCSNPFNGVAMPRGCDELEVRVVSSDKKVRRGDCEDTNSAVRPGEQICASADKVSLCLPMGGMASLTTSRAAPGTTTDTATGFAVMKCADGGVCKSQPNGAGICSK